MTGLAAGFLSRQNTWRSNAAHFTNLSQRAGQAARDASRTAASRAGSSVASMMARAKAIAAETRANTSRIGTLLERLPQAAQTLLTRYIGDVVPKNVPYLHNAIPLLRNLPIVSTGITGFAVSDDIRSGTHPVRAITAHGGGLAAGGAAVGMAGGGPGGALVGLVVGAGTTAAIKDFGTNPQPKYATGGAGQPGGGPVVAAAEMGIYYSDLLKQTAPGQWVSEQASTVKDWAAETASDVKDWAAESASDATDWVADKASDLKETITGTDESTVAPAYGDLPGENPESHQSPHDGNMT